MSSQNQNYTQADYLSALQAAMKQINPDLSVIDGDVIDCIFKATAQVLSASALNQVDPDSFWDISTKFGSDLDSFAAFLGFTRLAGQKANVVLQFYLPSPSTSDLLLPVGLQVNDDNGHVFATTGQAQIAIGQSQISIPAEAAESGTGYNVEAFTLTSFTSSVSASLQVQNPLAASGGTNAETDSEFRTRIKQNLFYRQIGTAASFSESLLEIDDNARVTTIGAQKWHSQYGALTPLSVANGGGSGIVSNVPDAQYVFPNSSYLIKNSGTADQTDYSAGIAYDFSLSNPTQPVFKIAPTGSLDLDSYSGSALDSIGAQIGLPRNPGTLATGMAFFSVLSSVNSTTVIPAFTSFSIQGNGPFQLTKTAYIEPLSQSGKAVPFESVQPGASGLSLGDNFYLNVGSMVPGNLYGTISAFTPGEEPWSDEEYRAQLLDFLASQSGLNSGEMVFTAFQYNPACSRCDIPNGITNKVDCFIDGSFSQSVTESGLIAPTEITTDTSPLWKTEDGNNVPAGSYIQILGTPAVMGLAQSTISIGGSTYQISLVMGSGKTERSLRSQAGLLWQTTPPASGESYVVSLIQNKALIDSQYQADKIAPLGLDVLVHTGTKAEISLNLEVLPMTNATQAQVQSSLQNLLETYFSSLPFGAFINFSKILSTVQSSPYVDSCAFAADSPLTVETPYAASSGIFSDSFYLNSNIYPVLGQITFNLDSTGSGSTSLGSGISPDIFIAQ